MIFIANRYWLGGNWSDTANWSATQGGTSGASVPTSADNVYWHNTPTSSTYTINTSANCLDLDFTGATNSPVLSGSSTINIYGSFVFISTISCTGAVYFKSTTTGRTINTNGQMLSVSEIDFAGGGTWTLNSDLKLSNTIYFATGNLITGGYAVNCGTFRISTTSAKSLTLGSSIITCSAWTIDSGANLSLSCGTSTIKLTGNSQTFAGNGLTYNNVEIQGTSTTITGSNTFNNLKISAGKTVNITAATTQTVTSLSGIGTSGSLITMQSTSAGTHYTLASSAINIVNYYSIKDCVISGVRFFKAKHSVDRGNNTNWVFSNGALSVFINGIDRRSKIAAESISISDEINARSTGTLNIIDTTGTYRPIVGEPIEIYNEDELIFGGSIDDLPEEKPIGTSTLFYDNVSLVDYQQICDRRIVAAAYESQTAGYIVNDIITNYLASEGITAGEIQDGQTVSKAVFNYLPASQCLDELSELTGFSWRVNADKTLDFFDRSTYVGTAITSTAAITNVKVKRSREQYRNRQYLRAGYDISTVQTRTFKGDGETQTFVVDLPIAVEPTIKVNGAEKTVGINSVETGKDWYWNKESNTVTQDSAGTKLTSSDTLTVLYQGFYPIIIVADDTTEVSSRATVEGGTGLYESVEEKTSIDTKDAALEYTSGLLRKYAQISLSITFDTFLDYKSGQLVNVVLPEHDISEDMLVSQVNITDINASDGRLARSVTLISGEPLGGWVRFFKKITDANTTFAIRENEVLIKLLTADDTFAKLTMSDIMTYNLHQYNICGQVTCGTGVYI